MTNNPTRQTVRCIAVDNGTNQAGVAVVDIDICDHSMTVVSLHQVRLEKLEQAYVGSKSIDGGRFGRYLAMMQHIRDIFETYSPDYVLVETPFFNRRIGAVESFAALREMLLLIRIALREYSSTTPYIGVTPKEAKQAAGVRDKKRGEKIDNKVLVREALAKADFIEFPESPPYQTFEFAGEDALDAVVVACYMRKLLMERNDRPTD